MAQIKDLDMLKKIDILFNNEIIIYGAGDYGKRAARLLKELEIGILGFCDSNASKWGGTMEGYKVISLQELMEMLKGKRIIFIIAMANLDDIEQVLKTLDNYGMSEAACYTYYALRHTVELNIEDSRIKDTYRRDMNIGKMVFREWRRIGHEFAALSIIQNVMLYNDAVLILNPGKVGSSTVAESLLVAQINCLHGHTLAGRWFGCKSIAERLNGIKIMHKAEKIKMISLIRDPISRGISLYFDVSEEYAHYDFVKPDFIDGVKGLLEMETKIGNYGAVFEWFNVEIKEAFDIDVYQYDFDKKRGYQIIQKNNVELLLIKTEKLSDCEEVIGNFVGKEHFKLVNSNTGNDSPYKFAYDELKRTIEIPKHILNFYYVGNRAMDHFYTLEEKEEFARKWFRKKSYDVEGNV